MPEVFYPDPALDVTVTPYRRTVGHEVEYSSGSQIATKLQTEGTGTPSSSLGQLHGYGCDCQHRNNYPIHTTSDSTAQGGEYLIGGGVGVLFGSNAYIKATKILSDAAIATGCGTNERVGMHTHVGLQDPDGSNVLTTGQRINILRAYCRYLDEIRELAKASLPEVRSNGCMPSQFNWTQHLSNNYVAEQDFWNKDENQISMRMPMDGHLRIGTHHNTVEFRIWNSTKAQWRMVLAGAVSTAIAQAGYENRRAHPDNPATLTQFLKGLLTPDIVVLIDRQKKGK